jgi:hypothetical protein
VQAVEKVPFAALLRKAQILAYCKYASALSFSCALHLGFLNSLKKGVCQQSQAGATRPFLFPLR